MDWGYTVSGFLVGALVGLTGVGGGSLMTPLLIFLFGISPALAVGTDLLFAAVTKSGGIWAHARRSTIEWRVVRLLATGSLPTALVSVYFLRTIREQGWEINTLMTSALGLALILTAVSILFKSRFQRLGNRITTFAPRLRSRRDTATLLAGVLLGILVPLSSVGAGALGAAMLLFLYPRLSTSRIVGTDIAHAVPLTAVAGLGHMQLGNVDFVLLGTLLLGSLPGIYLGSHFGSIVPERVMRQILAGVLMLIGFKFVLS
jgi:hypothetical protein